MAKARVFEEGSMVVGDKRVRAMLIRCASCSASEAVPLKVFKGPTEEALKSREYQRQFEKRGWIIGASTAGDRCMKCAAGASAPKQKPTLTVVETTIMPTQASTSQPAAPVPAAAAHSAAQPRRMDVQDALLIAGKLQEIYVDKDKGYEADWTDAKVAADLNVPRAWVTETRISVYGKGAADNENIRAAIEEARTLVTEVGGLLVRCRAALDAAARAQDEARKLNDEIGKFRSSMERIDRRIHAVEASLR